MAACKVKIYPSSFASNENNNPDVFVDAEGFPTFFSKELSTEERLSSFEEEEEREKAISSTLNVENKRQSLSLVHNKNHPYDRRLPGAESFGTLPVIDLHFDKSSFKNFVPLMNRAQFVERNPFQPLYPWFSKLHNNDAFDDSCITCSSHKRFFRVSDYVDKHPKRKESRRKRTRKKNKIVNISIWEEFYYGASLLDKKDGKPRITTLSSFFHQSLRGIVPLIVIECVVFIVFFSVFFMSCLVYNMFWQLLAFFFLEKHLSLHEVAEQKNIKVKFTGNAFQGPGFIYIRQVWCAHCAQIATQKITTRLMDSYRNEIKQRKEGIS